MLTRYGRAKVCLEPFQKLLESQQGFANKYFTSILSEVGIRWPDTVKDQRSNVVLLTAACVHEENPSPKKIFLNILCQSPSLDHLSWTIREWVSNNNNNNNKDLPQEMLTAAVWRMFFCLLCLLVTTRDSGWDIGPLYFSAGKSSNSVSKNACDFLDLTQEIRYVAPWDCLFIFAESKMLSVVTIPEPCIPNRQTRAWEQLKSKGVKSREAVWDLPSLLQP